MRGAIPGVHYVPIRDRQASGAKPEAQRGAEPLGRTGGRVGGRRDRSPGHRRRGSRLPGEVPALGGVGLPGCPLPAPRGGPGPRSSRDPGIAGRPDGNPAFDRDCGEGLSPWQHEGGEAEPSSAGRR